MAEEALIVPSLSLKMLIQVMIYNTIYAIYIMYTFANYATCLGLKSNKLGAAQPSLAWEQRSVIGMDFISKFQVQ